MRRSPGAFARAYGDDGWVFSQHDEMRKFNYIGDTQAITGQVVNKRVEGGRCLRGRRAARHQSARRRHCARDAIVLLPSGEHGPVVLPEPPDELKARLDDAAP